MSTIFTKPSAKTTVERILTKDTYYAPNIFISLPALMKMKGYVDKSDKEIAWLGLVEHETGGNYCITDVELAEQKVTGVTAEIQEGGLQAFAQKYINAGQYDALSKIKCWGHSHVEMSVSPSGTDESTFKDYYKNCDYFIRIIANKKGDLRLDYIDTKDELRFDNVDWKIQYPTEFFQRASEFEKIEETYNKAKEKINTMYDEMYNEVIKDIDDEIKAHVQNEFAYVSRAGYFYDEDYGDWYSNPTFSLNRNKIYNIITYKNTKWEGLDDLVFTLGIDEVVSIAEINPSVEELIELYGTVEEFVGYVKKDWEKLIEVCKKYYTNVYLTEVYEEAEEDEEEEKKK